MSTIGLLSILTVVSIAAACMDELRVNEMDDESNTLVSHWQLPDMFGLTGIHLLVASAEIAGFSLPAESDECESNPRDDEPIFDPPVPLGISPIWTATLASSGVVTLQGPELFGSLVSGFGMLAGSGTLDASSMPCSSIVLADASPNLLVAKLELIADGPIVVGNQLGSMTLERGRIELRGGALAPLSSRGDHVVGAGNARFTVIGEVDDEVRRTVGTNSTTIALIRDSIGWQTSSFDITVIDEQGQRWTLHIPTSHWH